MRWREGDETDDVCMQVWMCACSVKFGVSDDWMNLLALIFSFNQEGAGQNGLRYFFHWFNQFYIATDGILGRLH